MKFSTALPLILIVIIVIVLGSYIATQRAPTPIQTVQTITSATAAPAREKLDVMLDFIPTGIHVPFYAAADQGFFAKYGLEVNLIQNTQGSAGAIRALAAHRVDIGYADIGTVMVLMAKENITDVRAIARYYVTSPAGIQFLIGKGRPSITTPRDLEGKTLGSFVGNGEESEFPAFCKTNGIDCSKVTIQHASPATLNSGLLAGKFDAVLLFTRNVADLQPEAAKAGLTVGNFPYAKYGLDIYADMILTRTDVINSKPDMIKRFLQAFEEALQSSVSHPDSAVSSTLKLNPQLNYTITLGEWNITAQTMGGKTLLNAKDPLTNGWIDPAKLKTTITIVTTAFGVAAPDPSELYTNQFVKAP